MTKCQNVFKSFKKYFYGFLVINYAKKEIEQNKKINNFKKNLK